MITDQLPSFNSVASEGEALLDLDLGNLYRDIWIRATVAGGDKTADEMISDIELLVNGNPQREHTIPQLNEINTLHDPDQALATSGSVGTTDLVSYVPIFLAETFRKNVERGLALGWNAVGIRSLQLKVKLKAVTTPSLSAWASWTPADTSRGLGPITRWKRQDKSAGSSPQDFQKLLDVGGTRDNFLQSLHIWPDTGANRYVTEAELKFNSQVVHKRLHLVNQSILASKGMTPDTGATPRYDLVLDESDSFGDLRNLKNVSTQNLKLTFSGAPSGNMVVLSQITGPVL